MRSIGYILAVTVILGTTHSSGKAQTILNEYAGVESVMNLDGTDIDSLVVSDGSLFGHLDTVLFIQMKGAEILTDVPGLIGFLQNWNNAGFYSIHLVNTVVGDTVILGSSLREDMIGQKPGEVAQLIKIPGGDVFSLSGKYTCKPWDPVTGTGGVFAALASRKIVMNDAVIDVSGKGFLGGDPSGDVFAGDCVPDTMPYYSASAQDSSGNRGGSIVLNDFGYPRGYLNAANGGGGGNGKFSGGGGGSGYGSGGRGGKESESCSPVDNWGGRGGGTGKGNIPQNRWQEKRIFMGGGGGTGTQDAGHIATKGGNGGGIIILITDTLASEGNDTIRANGASVTGLATAGAGGGGGGGVIVADVENYTGNPMIEALGGNGGNSDDPANKTGPGGNGGGGLIWHRGNDLPGNVGTNLAAGQVGVHLSTGDKWGAVPSSGMGGLLDNLNVPIRGFLFNVMPYDQDVCQFIRPDTVWASTPKGGNGTFTYLWQQSSDQTTWAAASPEKNDSIVFIPEPKTDTTYYRRIVTSGTTMDTSLIYAINVLPALTSNLIADEDTICHGGIPVSLHHDAPAIGGGNGVYQYSWEESINSVQWLPAAGTSDQLDYVPGALTDTTYYRRVVRSHVCMDTSNVLRITVLDSLRGNVLYRDTSICQFTEPATLYSDAVTGGEPADRRYRWQASNDDQSWSDLGVTTADYDAGSLNDTMYYRRVLYSGSEDACVDTSNIVTIIVHEVITGNNIIVSLSNTVCENTTGNPVVQATGVFGGGNGSPEYTWQVRNWLGTTWSDAPGVNSQRDYQPGVMTDSSYFRRIINSGACRDTSSEVIVNVHPAVVGNLVGSDQVLCDFDRPDLLEDLPPAVGGGIGGYAYEWILSSPDSLNWTGTDSARVDFQPRRLSATTYFKRVVVTGACSDTSNLVALTVQDSIRNNTITNGTVDSTCFAIPLLLSGSDQPQLTGGDETVYGFSWIRSADENAWSAVPQAGGLRDYTTGPLTGPFYYRRIVASGACTDTTPSTLVRINPRPTGRIIDSVYAGKCYVNGGDPVTFEVLATFSGRPPYSFIFGDGLTTGAVADFDYPGEQTFPVARLTGDSAFYSISLVSLTDENGCEAFDTGMTGMATASLFKVPETMIDAGLPDEAEVCDSVYALTAIKDVGLGTWTTREADGRLRFPDQGDPATDAVVSFGTADSLHYRIYWTERNRQCISKDSMEVIFYRQPEPAVAGMDSTVYFADTIHLFALPPDAGEGIWSLLSGDAVIDDPADPFSRVDLGSSNLDLATEYAFKWTVTNGTCDPVEDEVAISRRDLRRYDGFSPDGNGINDYFVVRGLDYADSWQIDIFSRQGNLIRTVRSQDGTSELMIWDGKLPGGSDAEDGAYYYVLRVTKGNTSYEYKGILELARTRL